MKPPSRTTSPSATRTATGVEPAPVRLRVVVVRDDTAGEVVMGEGGGTVAAKARVAIEVGTWGSGGGEATKCEEQGGGLERGETTWTSEKAVADVGGWRCGRGTRASPTGARVNIYRHGGGACGDIGRHGWPTGQPGDVRKKRRAGNAGARAGKETGCTKLHTPLQLTYARGPILVTIKGAIAEPAAATRVSDRHVTQLG